jgi:hypothetical protein
MRTFFAGSAVRLPNVGETPGSTAAALLTLGIGATAAIFIVVDAVLLAIAPFPRS